MPQAAVIVEPRNHIHLPLVVFNAVTVLGPNWPIYIFHGTENLELCLSIQEIEPAVTLIQLQVDDLSVQDYSDMLCSTAFWEQIPTDSHVLIFQTDSLLLERSPHKIEDFLEWDWIGAPWPHLRLNGGNGGLSLRRKSAMLAAIQAFAGQPSKVPEDVRFCRILQKLGRFRLAPPAVAQKFSVEAIYYDRPFGMHKAYARLPKPLWQKLVTFEPLLKHFSKCHQSL